MPDLSPAAQAIVNAAMEAGGGYGYATPVLHARIAAVLRAAADHIDHDWSAFNCVDALYEIAAELEGAQ
jgi:NAD(P)H-dependent FMN reductase